MVPGSDSFFPRCPMCGSMWIAQNQDNLKPECETCGQKLRKKTTGRGFEVQ